MWYQSHLPTAKWFILTSSMALYPQRWVATIHTCDWCIQYNTIQVCMTGVVCVWHIYLYCLCQLVGDNSLVIIEYPIELGTLPQLLLPNESPLDRSVIPPPISIPPPPPSVSSLSLRLQLMGLRNRRYGRTTIALYTRNKDLLTYARSEEFLLHSKESKSKRKKEFNVM